MVYFLTTIFLGSFSFRQLHNNDNKNNNNKSSVVAQPLDPGPRSRGFLELFGKLQGHSIVGCPVGTYHPWGGGGGDSHMK